VGVSNLGYNKFESSTADRRLRFLAIIIIAFVIIMGALVAANYKHVSNLVKVVAIVRTQYLQPVEYATDDRRGHKRDCKLAERSLFRLPGTEDLCYAAGTNKGSFGGLGILVGVKDQNLTVVRAYQGTPAARAGIEAGDVIVKINESDARGIDLETAINLMRGPVGSTVNLTVERQGNTLQFNEIAREEISVPTVEGKVIVNSDIGYVIISQFTERTPEEMKAVLAELQVNNIKGLILDLRDNPGGELISAVNVAKNFIPRVPSYILITAPAKTRNFPRGQTVGLPLVVLITAAAPARPRYWQER
jgi:carboxyl-terminal processing protease